MRRTTLLALTTAGLVALGCGAGATGEVSGTADGTDTGGGGTDTRKVAAIGEPARDGKFEFTVTSAKCGVDKVGSGPLGATAQGQYCLVELTVENIGKQAQLLDGSSQKAYDAKGTEYSTDTEAALYANKKAETFLNEINPGNRVTGVIVFDVPKKVKLTEVKLHDSFLSGGVTVSLN
ncbi:DUF4352 domain-containing protein [Micromonospora sp. SH-82]|uniref:DUF4352 domain-containing protein n=1 Tax=Micromonospora sp. SH-82 TaxID=3132938 RepID=UPI003EB74D65